MPARARDPFDANQAIPTVLFGRGRRAFAEAFPALAIARIQYMSGFSCPASGGFSHGPFLPWALWSLLHRIDGALPSALMRWMAFRMLVVLERAYTLRPCSSGTSRSGSRRSARRRARRWAC